MPHAIPRPIRRRGPLAILPLLALWLPAACGGVGGEPSLPAEPVTVSLSVEGMHCGGCAGAVKERVAKMPGVSECEVSFEKGEATVTLQGPATTERVVEAIRRLGYTVELRSPESPAGESPAEEAPDAAAESASGHAAG